MSDQKFISVQGAREHNLQNIDLELPRNSLIVITGPSGSGKSSLAFDTIYAEGQRRYIESLSAYARQFLETSQKPDVDKIEGLSPAISIEQKTTSRNPRSTVGTVTEIYDYIRLLFARVGTPFSPATGLPITSQSITQMADRVLMLPKDTRLLILAPIIRGRKGEYKKELADLQKQGFQRVKIDGMFKELEDEIELDKKQKHDIDVVVDRIVLRQDIRTRLVDSMETALRLTDGLVIVELPDKALFMEKESRKSILQSRNETHERFIFSQKLACPVSGFTILEIEPRLFSFNNPFGACPSCNGLGSRYRINPELIIQQPELPVQNAIAPLWKKTALPDQAKTLEKLADIFSFNPMDAFNTISQTTKEILLYGSKRMKPEDQKKKIEPLRFEGIIPALEKKWKTTQSHHERQEIENFMALSPCLECLGYRLKPEALAIRINGKHIGDVSGFSIQEAKEWFASLPEKLTPKENEIAKQILKEISERLHFLDRVGLDYLSLSRNSGSLSGGESQRIRLASQVGSGLMGVLYVLDEPSIGLHQRDNARLLETLKHLRDVGNTVIVIEHDEDAILCADHVVDIGPGAGIHGGRVIAQGTPQDVLRNPDSLTGKYLAGTLEIKLPSLRPGQENQKYLRTTGARGNNLKNITAEIPLGTFTCVTGVSGCGKSTFLIGTLFKQASRQLMKAAQQPAEHDKIEGLEFLDKVIDIDQSPIGRTPRSNPATYTGAFTHIREWFAKLPESKARGYSAGRFSFNVKGGRCESCQGEGMIRISMHFLPDVHVACDVCEGKRYNKETLSVTFKGKSISDILEMSVEESLEFFRVVPEIYEKLLALTQVGLEYIKIGQSATTLSGGEAQRIKLAKELARKETGKTLYILDEPTTGLHFHDIAKLLDVLHRLVDRGNTIAVIEHNLEVIKTADWILDLGPEGGDKGGEVIAQGPPEKIMQEPRSHTGRFLKELFERRPQKRCPPPVKPDLP